MAALIDEINALSSFFTIDQRPWSSYEYYGHPSCDRLLHAFLAHTEEEKSEQ